MSDRRRPQPRLTLGDDHEFDRRDEMRAENTRRAVEAMTAPVQRSAEEAAELHARLDRLQRKRQEADGAIDLDALA